MWFYEGKTRLISKPGTFSRENQEYKLIKIKEARKLYENPYSMMRCVRKKCICLRRNWGTTLNFATPDPSCSSRQAPEKRISRHQVRQHIKKAVKKKLKETVEDQRWQGRLLWTRWEDDQLSEHGCFAWFSG